MKRTLDADRYQFIANVSPTELTLSADLNQVIRVGPCVFSNYPDQKVSTLRPYEVRVVHCADTPSTHH